MMKFKINKKILALVVGLLVFSTAALAATNGNGRAKCAGLHGGTTFVYSDTVGGTKLATGSIIQFIYAGANGIANDADATNAAGGYAGGDDTVISSGTVGTPWSTAGEFSYYLDNLTDYSKIYVRAWNGPSISVGTKYGNSTVYTVNGGSPKPTGFNWNVPSFVAVQKTLSSGTVALSAPTSATILKGGQNYTIKWTGTYTGNLRIRYYNGSTWSTLASSVPATNKQYSWSNVPFSNTANAKIEISNSGSAPTSTVTFMVDSTAPTVTNVQTNKTSYGAGDSITISWNATDALSGLKTNPITITYAADGSSFTTPVASNISGSSYTWTGTSGLSETTTGKFKVK